MTLRNTRTEKKRDIALFTAYLGTGCRVSELINLDIRDVCFDTSSFVVTRKGGDEQEIFMPVQVENELFTYMQERVENEKAKRRRTFISRLGTRMTAQGVEKVLKKILCDCRYIRPRQGTSARIKTYIRL